MSKFHVADGVTFERLGNGSVRVEKDNVFAVVIDAGSWASVVATVSPEGETAGTFAAAQQFHGGAVAEPAVEPATEPAVIDGKKGTK